MMKRIPESSVIFENQDPVYQRPPELPSQMVGTHHGLASNFFCESSKSFRGEFLMKSLITLTAAGVVASMLMLTVTVQGSPVAGIGEPAELSRLDEIRAAGCGQSPTTQGQSNCSGSASCATTGWFGYGACAAPGNICGSCSGNQDIICMGNQGNCNLCSSYTTTCCSVSTNCVTQGGNSCSCTTGGGGGAIGARTLSTVTPNAPQCDPCS